MSVCDLPNKIKIRTWRNGMNKYKNEEIEKVNFVFIVFWTSGDMHQEIFCVLPSYIYNNIPSGQPK